MKPILGFFSLFLSLLLASCNSQHDTIAKDNARIEPNFKSVSQNVFQNKCVQCHNPQKKEEGIDLSSYEEIFSGEVFPPLVVPGNPEQSTLYQSVATGKMPKDNPPLNSNELKAIYDWIKNGAKKEEQPKNEPLPDPNEPDPDEPGSDEPDPDEPG